MSWHDRVLHPSEWDVLLLSTTVKILLFPAYRSTDFEVHRNWLAITHSLPLSKWYYDTTSEWTLDYPPFFAYFEKILSIPAYFLDPRIVQLDNLGYDAWTVIVFQRTTVIFTELLLGAVLVKFIRHAVDPSMQRIISLSLFLHPGFLIVDHIHFQYNGFMYGILLWSVLKAQMGDKLTSGILFAVLLNFKHIYIYLAPAYFVYLLRSFCISPAGKIQVKNFLSLANAVIGIFLLSFGPFILLGQMHQVLARLFPFTRGLNHAYWAPNFWALYTALDRALLIYVKRTGSHIAVNLSGVESTSRGLVGDTVFSILPNVQPSHTFTITIATQMIALVKLWFNPSYKSFLTALTLCGYSSYLFGWHVHEKAILLVLVPLSLLAAERHAYFRTFLVVSVAGIFSLFPLLFTPEESVIKLIYSVIWLFSVYGPLSKRVYELPQSLPYVVLDLLEKIYLAGFVPLQLFLTILSAILAYQQNNCDVDNGACPSSKLAKMQFLPLMMTSVYCAMGIFWGFLRLIFIYLHEDTYQGQLNEIN